MTEKEITQILIDTHVLQTGHFQLTSGRHSDRYMQCARLFEDPETAAQLCAELAAQWREQHVQTVVGPAVGAVQMCYEVSRQLRCRNIFAERADGEMIFRRGFALAPGERVLVVEDTVTTGGSVKEVIALCLDSGATVVGAASIVDRSGGKVDFGVPFKSVYRADIQSWEAHDCALCRQGLPMTRPGSRNLSRGA